MRITVFGSGYVGLVTGACFANAGNHVVCVDVDETKIERLKKGDIPIFEPGLEEIVKKNTQAWCCQICRQEEWTSQQTLSQPLIMEK